MNTAKFRGQILDGPRKGEWVYGYLLKFTGEIDMIGYYIFEDNISEFDSITDMLIQVDPKTVGQYVGVKDANDKEIYADDIVTSTLVNSKGRKHKVEWREDLLGWSIQGHTPSKFTEVIGSIHSNPDLLTQ